MKSEVDKLDINKLINIPTSFNKLEARIDDLDVGKLKTTPGDFKKIKWCSAEWNCKKQNN